MKRIAGFLVFLLPAAVCSADIIYVDSNGTGDYPTIQAAINNANSGDEVVLLSGTYTGPDNRDIDFLGKAITVRGSTGNPNDCVIDCQGTKSEPHRGFNFVSGEDANSILETLTITNGLGPQEDIWGNGVLCSVGGAVYCNNNSSPILSHCIISDNSARYSSPGDPYGGGIFNYNSSPTIINCIIINNLASSRGGGIYNNKADPVIKNCFISNNVSTYGGGIHNSDNSSPTIRDCDFSDNWAYYGGGIANLSSNPVIRNCRIKYNSAETYGGGFYNAYSNPEINDCVISENSSYNGGGIWNGSCDAIICNSIISWNSAINLAGGIGNSNHSDSSITCCKINFNSAGALGGGIYDCLTSKPTISNCIINYNSASYGGGTTHYTNAATTLINCTIFDNRAYHNSGGVYTGAGGSSNIKNCIVWDNRLAQVYGTVTISYSDIQGGYTGIGNINADPLFAATDADDHHLKSQTGRWNPNSQNWVTDSVHSPCIDAGDPNSDWTFELWPHGKQINMGAYGGTLQASMSLSDVGSIANLDNDVYDIVDSADMALLFDKWCYEEVLLAEDLNRDGKVDFTDYAIFADHWLE